MASARASTGVRAELDLLHGAPTHIDLTEPAIDSTLEQAAQLFADAFGDDALARLDVELAERNGPLAARLAVKLAISRSAVHRLAKPMFVSVVFAVYQEQHRIRTRDEHEDGEDFLNRKLRQLNWLFADRADIGWELVVVDDGCPDGSGRLAQQVIDRSEHRERARVRFLQDGIANGLPPAAGLRSTDDSRKGGSILLGMWDAIQTQRDGHVVLYTDADLSTHLGQSGLLLEAVAAGAACAAGSRREPTSVLVKAPERNERGKLFIYLWKRLLAPLGDIVDTQCAFKAYPAAVVAEIVTGNEERRFAFDIELLLRTQLNHPGAIDRVPVAWIDSEAQSTTAHIQPYVPMLKAIAAMYRRYLPADATSETFAALVDGLDQTSWDHLLKNIPQALTEREPVEFGDFADVDADQLAKAARF